MASQRADRAWPIWWPPMMEWQHWERKEVQVMSSAWTCARSLKWSHSISKWERYGFEDCIVWWIKIWLDSHSQRVAVSCSMARWKIVMGGTPQWSILGSMLFNIFVNKPRQLRYSPHGFTTTVTPKTNFDTADKQQFSPQASHPWSSRGCLRHAGITQKESTHCCSAQLLPLVWLG